MAWRVKLQLLSVIFNGGVEIGTFVRDKEASAKSYTEFAQSG